MLRYFFIVMMAVGIIAAGIASTTHAQIEMKDCEIVSNHTICICAFKRFLIRVNCDEDANSSCEV